MEISLAPFDAQPEIVSEIESRLSLCDKLEESIEQGLAQAESLRQSILKRAFEGKLVPQDPTDEPASLLLERIRAEREAAGQKVQRVGRPRKAREGSAAAAATAASKPATPGARKRGRPRKDGTR